MGKGLFPQCPQLCWLITVCHKLPGALPDVDPFIIQDPDADPFIIQDPKELLQGVLVHFVGQLFGWLVQDIFIVVLFTIYLINLFIFLTIQP